MLNHGQVTILDDDEVNALPTEPAFKTLDESRYPVGTAMRLNQLKHALACNCRWFDSASTVESRNRYAERILQFDAEIATYDVGM